MKTYTIFYKEKVIQVLGNHIEHGSGGAAIFLSDHTMTGSSYKGKLVALVPKDAVLVVGEFDF